MPRREMRLIGRSWSEWMNQSSQSGIVWIILRRFQCRSHSECSIHGYERCVFSVQITSQRTLKNWLTPQLQFLKFPPNSSFVTHMSTTKNQFKIYLKVVKSLRPIVGAILEQLFLTYHIRQRQHVCNYKCICMKKSAMKLICRLSGRFDKLVKIDIIIISPWFWENPICCVCFFRIFTNETT